MNLGALVNRIKFKTEMRCTTFRQDFFNDQNVENKTAHNDLKYVKPTNQFH